MTWLKEHTFCEPQKKPATGAKKKVTRLFKRPSPSSKTASKKRRRTSKAKQKAQSTLDRKHREIRRKKIIQNCCHFSFTCAHISHIFPLFLFAWRSFFFLCAAVCAKNKFSNNPNKRKKNITNPGQTPQSRAKKSATGMSVCV